MNKYFCIFFHFFLSKVPFALRKRQKVPYPSAFLQRLQAAKRLVTIIAIGERGETHKPLPCFAESDTRRADHLTRIEQEIKELP